MIAQSVIDQVQLRADIKSVVEQYVQLRPNGRTLKCCCPFHQEKTPSFVVYPSNDTWYCFGCGEGGNIFSFVMKKEGVTFPEAVKILAHKFGVPIFDDTDEETEQHRQDRHKKDAMHILYRAVQKYYVAQLNADTPEAKEAKKYVVERWGDEFSQAVGIGYAPNLWQGLTNYAKANTLPMELLKEVELIKYSDKSHNDYDFFRGRVMIPIRDKFGNIIAYSGRTLKDTDANGNKLPKYINSTNSLIYNKSKSIYGIDIAKKEATRTSTFVLVEGAPDVLRLQSIDINEAVACLGADWTDEQFATLKAYANSLIFVPDADPPKAGEHYGTGINKVLKSGRHALQLGFQVFVKEIPLGENGTKNDAGSYCKTSQRYLDLPQEDFIPWYAKKRVNAPEQFPNSKSPVDDIAELFIGIEQEHEIDRLINLLNDVIKGKSMWRKAITEAKRRHNEETLKAGNKNTINLDLFEKFGFQEKDHTYISISGTTARPVRWSNFTLHPLFHIKDNLSALRLFEIENEDGDKSIVEFKQEDLISLAKFKQKIESLGNFVWLVKDEQLTRLKQFLYKTTETAELITQLGWQRKGFFAFGNGIHYRNQWYQTDDYGIVRLPQIGNYYLPAFSTIYRDDVQLYQFERRFIHTDWSDISLRNYTTQLIKVFGDNAKIGFAFYLATLFRDIVTAQTKSFPILNLFGPKGSGKSELAHSLMAFFIIENTPPNILNSTLPALADTVAQCANALVHIDEFKNSIDIDKREFLKGLWDGAGRNRMNMDKDKKREMTRVDCGVILSGQEMATADIALFSRFIFLKYSATEFTQEQKDSYQRLKDTRKLGCSHLTLQILNLRGLFETDFKKSYKQVAEDMQELLGTVTVEDRILLNWLIPLAAFHTLKDRLDTPIKYPEMLKIAKAGIIEQNSNIKQNNEIATFWDIVNYLRQEGQIYLGSDYRLEYLDKLTTENCAAPQEFNPAKQILILRYKRIFELYQIHGKRTGETLLPKNSLAYYLQNSPSYLGWKRSVRFKNIIQGIQQRSESLPNSGSPFLEESTVEQAYCFDYEMLQTHYGLSLEVSHLSDNLANEQL